LNDRESVAASRVEPSGMNGIEEPRRIVGSAKRAENSYRTDESLTAAIAADTHRRVTGWQQAAIGRRTYPSFFFVPADASALNLTNLRNYEKIRFTS